jgi:hypothetical protein
MRQMGDAEVNVALRALFEEVRSLVFASARAFRGQLLGPHEPVRRTASDNTLEIKRAWCPSIVGKGKGGVGHQGDDYILKAYIYLSNARRILTRGTHVSLSGVGQRSGRAAGGVGGSAFVVEATFCSRSPLSLR